MQILNRGKVFNQNFSPGSHRIFLLRFGSVINDIPRHTEKEEKSLTEMLCTLDQSTMYQMKIMFKNLCIIRLATSRCQYLSCFKDSGEFHYAPILFHENTAHTAHTGAYVTSIYSQRIFVKQNYSYKFTWFILNNRKSQEPLERIINGSVTHFQSQSKNLSLLFAPNRLKCNLWCNILKFLTCLLGITLTSSKPQC